MKALKVNYRYRRNGAVVHLIEETKTGFIVCNIRVEDETEEELPEINRPFFAKKEDLFKTPPKYKEDERRVTLLNSINELAIAKDKLLQEISNTKAKLEKFKGIQQAKTLLDFLDGKITHAVTVKYGDVNILSLEETLGKIDRYDGYVKLISLFGGSKGNLEWRINDYSDGSGSYSTIFPCTSYEEALLLVGKILHAAVTEWRKKGSIIHNTARVTIDVASRYHIDLDDDYIEAYHTGQKKSAEKGVVEAQIVLIERKAKLEKLTRNTTHNEEKKS